MLLPSLNYIMVKLHPMPYHLTNILLHIVNTIFAFMFLGLFFKTESAFLGACLFAVHPIHAEAVSWISGKPYLILGLAIFLSYFFYHWAVQQKDKLSLKFYILSLTVFLYTLVSSYSFYLFFVPFLVLCDLVLARWQRTWKLWIPFFLIAAVRVFMARVELSGRLHYVVKEMGLNQAEWTNPINNMAYSLYSHFGLLVWPEKLSIYHEPAVIASLTLKIILGVLFILLVFSPIIFKKAKEVFLALGIFVLFLAPTYSPVPFSWLFAERYVYFPAISLSIILVFLYEKYAQKCPNRRHYALVVFLLIVAAYAARTVARNEDWQTPGRLWRQTVAVSDLSPRAHNNMGDTYGQEGNTAGAIREFKRAIELRPDYADAYHNLANTYESQGSSEEAIKYYLQAVNYNPGLFESQYNLGLIYLNKGDKLEAIRYLTRAKELHPDDPEVSTALNMAYKR
ncbi:MAG: tetratricopeptide repeat protein [Candidatus Omnitrophica bacterium]|nr:tetratricopeptide repeat protein [Candidatus Omnitrophota bacterium]